MALSVKPMLPEMRTDNIKVKCVVFDADDTVFTLNRSIGSIYSDVLATLGHAFSDQELNRAIKESWHDLEPAYLNTSNQHRTTPRRERIFWDVFIAEVLKRVGLKHVKRRERDLFYQEFSRSSHRRLNEGFREVADQLMQHGFTLAIASNNDGRLCSILEGLGIRGLFTHIFVAAELGWKKPSECFFGEIARRLEIDPTSLVHIGNSERLDISPALKAGWYAALYCPLNWKTASSVPRISSFQELRSLLG